ncbi:MAG: DUF962 domain-containing protein [Aestuariibacter sp.]
MLQQANARQIDQLLAEYGESHQNKTNKLIHAIAVPAIFWVTVALIWSIPTPEILGFFDITWAHVFMLPVLYYYFMLSGPIGAAMTLLTIVTFVSIGWVAATGVTVWQFSLVLFVVMWILQFIGHHIEGKKPSFLKDIQFLLVGPAWWWVHWLKRMDIRY